MNEIEKTELDTLNGIFQKFPDLLKGNLKTRYDLLTHKRNCEIMEEQEKLMGSITSALAKEISDEIDKEIIKQIMDISIDTASGESLKKLQKLVGVDPIEPQIVDDFGNFIDNQVELIGAANGSNSIFCTTYQLG